jgi:hypothetical protein
LGSLPPRVGTGARGAGGVAVATTTSHAATTVATAHTAAAVAAGAAASSSAKASTAAAAAPLRASVSGTRAATEATDIAVGRSTTSTTTAATTTTTAAAEATTLTGDSLEEGGDLLVGLLEKVEKVANDTSIAAVEESSGNTSVSGTTSTTDTVDIVVDVGGEIVVDDVLDVGDIETTGCDSGGNEDGATSRAEHLEGTLTLALGAVTVNRGGGEALVDEEVGERIGHTLGLDEDQSKTSAVGVEDVEQDGALVNVLDVLNLLGDVLRGGTDTTDREEDILLEEVTGQQLDVAGEGGREHESLAAGGRRHILTFDDAANLGLETHVQHAISLVENKVLDVLERDATTFDQIDETTGGSDEEIATALDLAELVTNVGTTVDDARADPRTVGELAGLLVDLGDKLTSGGEDERGRVSLALAGHAGLSRGSAGSVDEGLGEDGEEETTSLSGTGLGTSHQITAAHDDGNGVFLDGSGDLVAGELDVADKVVVERRVGEGGDGVGNALATGLDGDVVVLLEVDTAVLHVGVVGDTEQLALDTRVGGTRDVLAVLPLAVTGATGLLTAALAGVAVGVSVEAVAASGSESGSTAPAAASSTAATTSTEAGPEEFWSVGCAFANELRGDLLGPVEVTVHRGSAVHSSRRTGSRASGASSGVRRDVGRADETTVAVLSWGVLRFAQREVVHVELIGHVCDMSFRSGKSGRVMGCRLLG